MEMQTVNLVDVTKQASLVFGETIDSTIKLIDLINRIFPNAVVDDNIHQRIRQSNTGNPTRYDIEYILHLFDAVMRIPGTINISSWFTIDQGRIEYGRTEIYVTPVIDGDRVERRQHIASLIGGSFEVTEDLLMRLSVAVRQVKKDQKLLHEVRKALHS